MKPKKSKPAPHQSVADSTAAVDEFMHALDHRFKKEIEALRKSILSVDDTIAEGIKWNAPSFRTREYFATVNLREKQGIGLILHLGAKVRVASGDVVIDDPAKLLKWLAKDRGMIVFDGPADFNAKKPAFERVLRQWIKHV
jgi:hypothetical protein